MNLTILKGLAALAVVLCAFATGWNLSAKYAKNVYDKQKAEADSQQARDFANAQQSARAREQELTQRIAGIDREYQEKIKAKDKERMAALAVARSRGLYVRAACPNGSLPDAATGTRSGDGTARVRLSEPDAGFLLGLASEADQITEQLAACQTIVRADRE